MIVTDFRREAIMQKLIELADTSEHKSLRRKLVRTIRSKGITDEAVLDAIGKVPRHFFFHPVFLEFSYEDRAFRIGEGQTISQPFTVAYQTQLLDLKKGEKILEIGTGSGYQACVLAEMGAEVYTIERQTKLYENTKPLIEEMHIQNIMMFHGDGFEGLPAFMPYDKILITAAVPEMPVKLFPQLKTGGFLVMPFGKGRAQRMQRIIKINDDDYEQENYDVFQFVPNVEGKERKCNQG